ncbi:MAG: hypothetical protein ACI9DC_002982 [Gammaproteobacteria bacterium]|jgi:hypothetical protein
MSVGLRLADMKWRVGETLDAVALGIGKVKCPGVAVRNLLSDRDVFIAQSLFEFAKVVNCFQAKSDMAQVSRARIVAQSLGEGNLVVLKDKPSCCMKTPLDSWLRYQDVDTLLVMGTTTSGCVRAAVIDAFSHNFRTIVAQDARANRADIAHPVNVVDMKYADVMSTSSVVDAVRAHTPR